MAALPLLACSSEAERRAEERRRDCDPSWMESTESHWLGVCLEESDRSATECEEFAKRRGRQQCARWKP